MGGVPLVELVVAGHEHGRRSSPGPARAAGLLPHRRERARETVQDHGVEPADVDAELERVRCRDAEQTAARDVEFERAPLVGEITGAVRGDAIANSGSMSFNRRRAYWATTSAPRRLRVNASV